jgi:ribonuclease G
VSSDLIIDVTPSEIVIALQENKRLVELTREKSGAKFAVGDIYLGKVKKDHAKSERCFYRCGI